MLSCNFLPDNRIVPHLSSILLYLSSHEYAPQFHECLLLLCHKIVEPSAEGVAIKRGAENV